jgi:hypothetical protein
LLLSNSQSSNLSILHFWHIYQIIICPIIKSTTSFTTYKAAKWSPRGGNEYGKCILATLTLDHRLCIHSMGKMNSNFKLLFELSDIYAKSVKLKDLNFGCLKEAIYRISAVEMSWSPVITATFPLKILLLQVMADGKPDFNSICVIS